MSQPSTIVLLSNEEIGSDFDDKLLFAELQKVAAPLGIRVVAVSWTDATFDWKSAAFIVVRAPYDYINNPEKYLAWHKRITEEYHIPIYNDFRTIQWNIDKRYLQDLQTRGVAIVETEFLSHAQLSQSTQETIRDLMKQKSWSRAVFKPCVGNGSQGVVVLDLTEERKGWDELAAAICCAKEGQFMLQPYLAAVKEGEISLLFFDGLFSHAVRRTPLAENDISWAFKVVVEHIEPSQVHKDLATKTLAAAVDSVYGHCGSHSKIGSSEYPFCYARVDIIGDCVSELELFEPWLFFETPNAASKFANCIRRRYQQLL